MGVSPDSLKSFRARSKIGFVKNITRQLRINTTSENLRIRLTLVPVRAPGAGEVRVIPRENVTPNPIKGRLCGVTAIFVGDSNQRYKAPISDDIATERKEN